MCVRRTMSEMAVYPNIARDPARNPAQNLVLASRAAPISDPAVSPQRAGTAANANNAQTQVVHAGGCWMDRIRYPRKATPKPAQTAPLLCLSAALRSTFDQCSFEAIAVFRVL